MNPLRKLRILRLLKQLVFLLKGDEEMSKVLEFLKNAIPTLEWIAKITPTPIDDQVVAIIKMLLNNPSMAADVKDHMESKGMKP